MAKKAVTKSLHPVRSVVFPPLLTLFLAHSLLFFTMFFLPAPCSFAIGRAEVALSGYVVPVFSENMAALSQLPSSNFRSYVFSFYHLSEFVARYIF